MRRGKQEKTFAGQVKGRLAEWGSSISDLAASIPAHRVSVSRAINHPPSNPRIAQKIRKILELP